MSLQPYYLPGKEPLEQKDLLKSMINTLKGTYGFGSSYESLINTLHDVHKTKWSQCSKKQIILSKIYGLLNKLKAEAETLCGWTLCEETLIFCVILPWLSRHPRHMQAITSMNTHFKTHEKLGHLEAFRIIDASFSNVPTTDLERKEATGTDEDASLFLSKEKVDDQNNDQTVPPFSHHLNRNSRGRGAFRGFRGKARNSYGRKNTYNDRTSTLARMCASYCV